jgi:hypothetical protein
MAPGAMSTPSSALFLRKAIDRRGRAAEPTGEWRGANGAANIRIDDCHGALWGIIS